MQKFLLILMMFPLSMGYTVCQASNLQNVENNYEGCIYNEKVVDHGSFVLHLKEQNHEELHEEFDENIEIYDGLRLTCFKPYNDDNKYVIEQKEDGSVEYYILDMDSYSDDEN